MQRFTPPRRRYGQWKPPLGVGWNPAAPVPTPTGAYYINEVGGTTLYNIIGNGHNGTFNGAPIWGGGATNPFSAQYGMGLACQTNAAYVDFGTIITSTAAMTVIVIAEANVTTSACLLSQRSATTQIACQFIQNGTPAMRFLFYNGTTTVSVIDPSTLDTKTYMWGGTYDGANLRLYKNGDNVATTATSGNITGLTAPFRLNNSNDGGSAANNNFYGLWVWDGVALNPAQMEWMYANTFPQNIRWPTLWVPPATTTQDPNPSSLMLMGCGV
jgi:hypothetical protein